VGVCPSRPALPCPALPCPALAALAGPCPCPCLSNKLPLPLPCSCPMSLNRQTPHFLRLETKRYGFFLGYGFQDLDGQTDRHVALIYKVPYYNYHGHSKKNPNPKKENKMGGYDGISCMNIVSNPWKLITLLILYFKYFCCTFAPNRCHPMSSSPFFAYTLGCVDEGLQVFIIFYVMGIV
jgi:hypothetical protein